MKIKSYIDAGTLAAARAVVDASENSYLDEQTLETLVRVVIAATEARRQTPQENVGEYVRKNGEPYVGGGLVGSSGLPSYRA